jgi:hypothetical protein
LFYIFFLQIIDLAFQLDIDLGADVWHKEGSKGEDG